MAAIMSMDNCSSNIFMAAFHVVLEFEHIYIVIYSNFEFEFKFDLSSVVANDIVSEWGMLRVSHCWGQYAVVVSGRLFRTYRAMRWMCLLQLPGRSFMHHWSDSGAACWCGAWAHSAVREITKSSRTFSATNFSSNFIRLLQIQMKSKYTWINSNHDNIAIRSHKMIYNIV